MTQQALTLGEFIAHVLLQIESAQKVQCAPDESPMTILLFQLRDICQTWKEMEHQIEEMESAQRAAQAKEVGGQTTYRVVELRPGERATVKEGEHVVLVPRPPKDIWDQCAEAFERNGCDA